MSLRGFRTLIALLFVSTIALAQQSEPNTAVISTPPVQPQPHVSPASIPAAADAPVPDQATISSTEPRSPSSIKRAVDRLRPVCIDGLLHTCWGTKPNDEPFVTEEDRQFLKEMDVGDTYLKSKNYRGAELRFREALGLQPDNPDATFKLARVLSLQGKNDEAKNLYESYLKMQKDGRQADYARNELLKINKQSGNQK
jgi:tetratricopeptide (TPR) repeat protein